MVLSGVKDRHFLTVLKAFGRDRRYGAASGSDLPSVVSVQRPFRCPEIPTAGRYRSLSRTAATSKHFQIKTLRIVALGACVKNATLPKMRLGVRRLAAAFLRCTKVQRLTPKGYGNRARGNAPGV
jgi:hypothetical protein